MNIHSSPFGVEGEFAGRIGSFQLDARFALAPNRITALSGPSGSGKSTLMRCIAGLLRLPGRLVVGGEIWQDQRTFLAPHRRRIGVVFQDASLLPHLSVRDNLLYGARRASEVPTEGLADVVDLLGLANLLSRSPENLSGGERQRVALGRTLLSKPRLLLMDEPLSSLDAASKADILPYLEALHRSLAIPVLYVSHDAGEIARLADVVLHMRDGRILQSVASSAVSARCAANADAARSKISSLDSTSRDRLAMAALLAGLPQHED